MNAAAALRFWSKVDRTGGDGACWQWLGRLDKDGYGLFWLNYRLRQAHQVPYESKYGRHGKRLLRHVCHNPACVNPDHLLPGTDQDNSDDRTAAGRTPRGESHALAKTTAAQVMEMRARHASGTTTQVIAEAMGIPVGRVRAICSGSRWRHLPLNAPEPSHA